MNPSPDHREVARGFDFLARSWVCAIHRSRSPPPRKVKNESQSALAGVFTSHGVAGEESVGKAVAMRTVISIASNERHVFELFFWPPGKSEMLATRAVDTRLSK